MSYDIDLKDEKGAVVQVGLHEEGGTYVLGGRSEASLNITYNYADFFYTQLDTERGIRWLYGKTGAECIPRMEKAVAALGTVRDADYWKPTPGNAGYALSILLGWARLHPTAKFDGD